MSIIFGVSIIPTTALGAVGDKALVFTLENADKPTLYQEVKVKIEKDTTAITVADVNGFKKTDKFVGTDEIYFIKTTLTGAAAAKCEPATSGIGTVKVVPIGDYALATVIITSDFAVGGDATYKMCYKKAGVVGGTSSFTVYDVLYKSTGATKAASFAVLPSVYTAYTMDPPFFYAGQGPVTLTITAKAAASATAKTVTQQAYLIPCLNSDCISDTFSENDKNHIAALCSGTGNKDAITTTEVTGLGTGTLTAKLIAPKTPAFYGVC
eukprot:Tbor_TRINITY_DN5647_c4_g1::TRINITY_DN5647_c4_g1_i4::g.8444::m.8444